MRLKHQILLVRAVLVTWGGSLLFPIVGGFMVSPDPWWGVADVALAATFAFLWGTLLLVAHPVPSAHSVETAYSMVSGMATVAVGLLGVYFVVGPAYRWEILVPGLIWRGAALIWALPTILNLLHSPSRSQE